MAINKIQYGNSVLIDLTSDTITADKLMQGYTAHDRTGTIITGTATGGSGLTTQIVLPEQSITATIADANGYDTHITNLVSEELTADENYIVTMDGETYLCHTENIYSAGDTYMGDVDVVWGNAANAIYPFCCATWANHVTDWMVADNSAHTVKIERVVSYDESVLTTKAITANGTYNASSDNADGYSSVTVNVPTGSPTIQSLTVNPSTTQQTFNASGVDGYKPVTVNAMPSGTAGTPTATKGTVSNHAVTVTPSVTNSAGYISGGTINGTAVTVTASELASGNKAITENGTDIDVVGYSTVSVDVPSGSSKNTQVVQGTTRTTSSTLTAIGAEMTVSKTGTYDVYWSGFRSSTSSSYTYGTQLYVNGTAYGTQNTTWSNHVQNNHLTGVSLTANQKIRVYGRNSRGSSYYIYAPMLVIVEA